MNEIKRCPFCGWEFAEHAWNEFGEEYMVCDQCGASSGTVDSKWDWQSRPIEDALQAENEQIKEDLQHEKTRSQLNFEAEERRMLNITYYCAEIDRLNARIAKLEEKLAELVEVGNKMRDLIEQDYDGYLDETIEWRGVAEEADDVLQEREE